MKKIYVLCLLLISTTAFSQEVKRNFSVAPGKLFTLKSHIGGTIVVKGSGQNNLSVAITHNGGDKFDFNFSETAEGVSLEANGSKNWNNNRKVKFEVSVPETFNLNLSTSGGNISIQNVKGDLNGKTSGGNLELSGTKGKIVMKTSGGNINFTKTTGEGVAFHQWRKYCNYCCEWQI